MKIKSALLGQDDYTPNHLLDTVMQKLGVKSDAALARALDVPPSTISKVRHKQVGVNSTLLLAVHEATEMSIRDLRDLMGDRNTRYWLGNLGTPASENREPLVHMMRTPNRSRYAPQERHA